ncbi:MAG: hypothetical protein K5905_30200 [Roseibium sp.]|uniref:hypothetical protein n=1 Tax=Roseibium sp. TaxID=1936156 RepID=UPI0026289961|nr:hypothetical protein [Roseibium sp.]MCV0429731.1 hypothetical protein [Roseibium sp.]
MEEIINELVETCRRMSEGMRAHISDDDLLIDLRAQLDAILGAKNEALPMEVYTFVVMRALRVLKEDL